MQKEGIKERKERSIVVRCTNRITRQFRREEEKRWRQPNKKLDVDLPFVTRGSGMESKSFCELEQYV
jgi:hypothetical protein